MQTVKAGESNSRERLESFVSRRGQNIHKTRGPWHVITTLMKCGAEILEQAETCAISTALCRYISPGHCTAWA